MENPTTESSESSTEKDPSSIGPFLAGLCVAFATWGTVKTVGRVKVWNHDRKLKQLAELQEAQKNQTA
jgi:hypothetical protein